MSAKPSPGTTACCAYFRKAQETGTDNEGYGCLIWKLGDALVMGTDLPPVLYCPWCGTELEPSA